MPEAVKARPPGQQEGESPGHALLSSLPHNPTQAGTLERAPYFACSFSLSLASVPLTVSLPLFQFPSCLCPSGSLRHSGLLSGSDSRSIRMAQCPIMRVRPQTQVSTLEMREETAHAFWPADHRANWLRAGRPLRGHLAYQGPMHCRVRNDKMLSSFLSATGPGTVLFLLTLGWEGLWPGAGRRGSWIPWSPPPLFSHIPISNTWESSSTCPAAGCACLP